MQTLLGVFVAILVFGVMIFVHELGHYLAARACKVKVLEFAVGMGPKLLSRQSKKTGIVYSLRAFPIGGFTAMQGEDGEDSDPQALVNRPRWQRLIVLFAGSFMNLLTGVLAMFLYISLTGVMGSPVVADFRENSVSDQWLRPMDEIIAIDGREMLDYSEIGNTIMLDGIRPLDILVLRDGEEVLLEDVTFAVTEEKGVTVAVLDFRFLGVRPTFSKILQQTFTRSVSTVKLIYRTFVLLLSGRFGMEGVSGPVGTVSVISEATSDGFPTVLYLFSFISLNLGLTNLLPLPALDGGRILFTLVEMVIRRPIPAKFETYIHAGGMIALLGFMAIITVMDVMKLIS